MRLKDLIIKNYTSETLYVYSREEIDEFLDENDLEANIADGLMLIGDSEADVLPRYHIPHEYLITLVCAYAKILQDHDALTEKCFSIIYGITRFSDMLASEQFISFPSDIRRAVILYEEGFTDVARIDFIMDYLKTHPGSHKILLSRFKNARNLLIKNDIWFESYEHQYHVLKTGLSELFENEREFINFFASDETYIPKNAVRYDLSEYCDLIDREMEAQRKAMEELKVYENYADPILEKASYRHKCLSMYIKPWEYMQRTRDWLAGKINMNGTPVTFLQSDILSHNILIAAGEWDTNEDKKFANRLKFHHKFVWQEYESRGNLDPFSRGLLPYDKKTNKFWHKRAELFYKYIDNGDLDQAFNLMDGMNFEIWLEVYRTNLQRCGKWIRKYNWVYRFSLCAIILNQIEDFKDDDAMITEAEAFFNRTDYNDFYKSDVMFYAYAYRSVLIYADKWNASFKQVYKRIKSEYKQYTYVDCFPYF